MEGSGNNRLDSFCVQVVKNVISPLESTFRKIAKNFENGVPRNVDHHIAVNGDEKKNANFPVKIFAGLFARNYGNNLLSNVTVCGNGVLNLKERYESGNGWEVDRNSNGKTRVQKKMGNEDSFYCGDSCHKTTVKLNGDVENRQKELLVKGKCFSFEYLIGSAFDQLIHFPAFDVFVQENGSKNTDYEPLASPVNEFDHFLARISGGKGARLNGFSSSLKFGRVGGVPSSIFWDPSDNDAKDEGINCAVNQNGSEADSPQKLDHGLLRVPLSNKERLRSILSTISWTELSVLLSPIGRPFQEDHLDKKKLLVVQYFFRCTEAEGNFFQELDRDGDEQVSLQDLEVAMRKRKFLTRHAPEFMCRARSCLLPSCQLQKDSRRILSEVATAGADPPNVEISVDSVLKSALAGGISCALSAAIMHPIDTIKTQAQASTLSFPEILSMVPPFGVQGLYKGSIPAILGQFSSHGLRTGICETSKFVLLKVAPTLPEIQVQSLSSFCSTFLGTAMRIPCEVLKQRLQVGLYQNVGEAIVGTWRENGLRGFFRGTGMTLCREIPFYVAGSSIYDESKKAAQKLLGRELEPWETVFIGALSGGFTAVLTTPFDVIKTRMMTATEGRSATLSVLVFSILRHEGPLGLFKGAIPRFFWVAPLGAMNFAGYELIRKTMD